MLSCAPTCRPASRGASAIVASASAGGLAAPSALKRTAIAIPIILFVAFLGAGLAGLLGVAAAYSYYSQGLPDPEAALTDLEFDQQTIVTDRTGKIELARLGERKREVVTFAELTAGDPRRDDRDRGQGLLGQPGLRPRRASSRRRSTRSTAGPRGGSTITQQLVRARLLPPSAFDGSREERKIREIIQSLRLTQAYPGETGKQQIITAYLNQNFYGNQSLRREGRGPARTSARTSRT